MHSKNFQKNNLLSPPVQVKSKMMPPEVKKYLNRNIQVQFDKDPALQTILSCCLLLVFSFCIITRLIFHQSLTSWSFSNAELPEDFKTGITFKIWAEIGGENWI